MAIAQRQAGVTRGYKSKTKRAARCEPSLWQRIVKSLRVSAREMREFVVDEIVYETMDTLRVLDYLRYELGFRTRTRVKPVVHELEQFVYDHELIHEVGTFSAEQVRVLAKR
ncbi:MAG: hypothetical protein EYC68_16745 [Chloroflexota bacterium]|nr:MAG: hypothetical protein EYC68_16745 [Chloroflexota bacterium]